MSPLTSMADAGKLKPPLISSNACWDSRNLWTGSLNRVKLQIWATWLFYAVLLDLADSVANQLEVPTESISIEMLFPGLYHFNVAHSQGKASAPITYFTAPENADLAIVKRIPKSRRKPELDLSPYPVLTTASTP